jgi:hypothetical protein
LASSPFPCPPSAGGPDENHPTLTPPHHPSSLSPNPTQVYAYGAHPLTRARYAHIPGPRKRWLTGNIREIFAAGMPGAYAAWAREYGPVFHVFFGSAPAVVVSDPATIKALQLSQHTRPQIMSPIDLTLSPTAASFFKANMLVTKDRAFHRVSLFV